MKRFIIHIAGLAALLLSFADCREKDLFLDPPQGNIEINVEIHWDSVPANMLTLPMDMTVHWYPEWGGSIIASDYSVYGGQEWLDASIYDVMCMDFNGPTTLSFRSDGTREDFEVYNARMTGTYNSLVPQLPGGEITVAEAYPYQFYIDSRSQTIDTKKTIPKDSVHTVHFYPKNVLREFTFMVYDVTGAQYISNNTGAISGMSGSYFPASQRLASTPSTILFSRVETVRNAQTSPRWTEQDKALFAAKNPDWASTDTLVGWTRDWTIGKFVTFGPLNRDENRFRLTVEALTQANNRFNGSWGYWHGQWENTVAAQIDSAMGTNGTLEEQLAWRQRNGGYDIILYNDHRLIIPPEQYPPDPTDGGFSVSVNGWGPMIEVPTARSLRNAALHSAMMRASINTDETIPDFVVNGIYSEDGSFVFNEQYVYKPESGTIWDYYPKKYWPSTGSVDFYAYAPAGLKNLVTGLYNNPANPNNPPVIEYAMPLKNSEEPPPGSGEPQPDPSWVEDQEDLLIAVQTRTAPPIADPVQMDFHHAFSRVTVKAKTDPDDYSNNYRIKVVRVDLRNLYTRGKLTLDKNVIPDAFVSGATLWHGLCKLANYRFSLKTAAVSIDDGYTELLDSDGGIFVMPQTIGDTSMAQDGQAPNNTEVYIEYDIYIDSPINGEQYYTTGKKMLSLTNGFAFEIGRQYELQITLDVKE